jgi:hypothetical protein
MWKRNNLINRGGQTLHEIHEMAVSRVERNVSTARSPLQKEYDSLGDLHTESQHPSRYLDVAAVPGQSPRLSLLNPIIFKSH